MGLCLSWGWTCTCYEGLGDRKAGAHGPGTQLQLLVAELLVCRRLPGSPATPGVFCSLFCPPAPASALPAQEAAPAPTAQVTAALPCPAAARCPARCCQAWCSALMPAVWSCRAEHSQARLLPSTRTLLGPSGPRCIPVPWAWAWGAAQGSWERGTPCRAGGHTQGITGSGRQAAYVGHVSASPPVPSVDVWGCLGTDTG